jgi:hypothetical protein
MLHKILDIKKKTMKTRILSVFTLATLLFVSCSKDGPEAFLYKGDDFVSFENITSTSIAVSEDQEEAKITVKLSRVQPVDVAVTITIEEIQVNVGYSIPNSNVIIPAGETEGSFIINPIDDDVNTPSTILRATITATTPALKIGLREVGSYSKTITIVNDDCPTKFNLWFGAVNVVDVGYATINGTGSGNAGGDCDILRVTTANNLVGWTSGAFSSVPHDFTFLPDFPNSTTGLVEIPSTEIGQANFNFPGGAGPGVVLYTITYGEYNETTKVLEADYQVRVRRVSDGALFNLSGWSGTNRVIKP